MAAALLTARPHRLPQSQHPSPPTQLHTYQERERYHRVDERHLGKNQVKKEEKRQINKRKIEKKRVIAKKRLKKKSYLGSGDSIRGENDGGRGQDALRGGEGGDESEGGGGDIGDHGPHAGDRGRDEGGH